MKRVSCSTLIFLSAINLFAQTEGVYFFAADTLQKHERIWLNRNWKYHTGEDVAWANPDFNDSAWETARINE